jgi:hypothetical protein
VSSHQPKKARLEDSLSRSENQFRRNLEEAFFLAEDQKLVEKLTTMRRMEKTKEDLKKVSGIANESVLEKLVALGIRPETVASLSLVPLIEVAWADGQLDTEEKKAILLAATEAGFARESIDYELLKQWITHKPTARLLEAWTHYCAGLCEALTQKERISLKEEILAHARDVAKASGGLLGLGIGSMISAAENAVLKKLEAVFDE